MGIAFILIMSISIYSFPSFPLFSSSDSIK